MEELLMDIRKVVEVIYGQKLTQKEKRILKKMVSRSNRISREQQLFVNGEVILFGDEDK